MYLQRLAPYYKSVAAFCALLVPFLTALGAALSDGVIYASEWTTIAAAGAALVAGTKAVYTVSNQPQ